MSEFFNEVRTQPEKLISFLEFQKSSGYKEIEEAASLINKAGNVFFSGMGTSFYAPACVISDIRYAKRSFIIEASELARDGRNLIGSEDVLVLLSQSGESIEVINVIGKLKGICPIIGITNDEDSTLARNSDAVIHLMAGDEKSITNKTFTNTMAALYLLTAAVTGKDYSGIYVDLRESAQEMEEILEKRKEEIQSIASSMEPADVIHFIGREGVSMTIANQSALIFMEGATTSARAFSSGAFRHGPIEICSPNHRVIMYDNSADDDRKIMRELALQIKSYGSHIVVVSNEMLEEGFSLFRIKAKSAIGFSMAASMFMELLLIETARLRGRVAGEFCITNKICSSE